MAAYVIYHLEQAPGSRAREAGLALQQRIAELWDDSLQLDSAWVVAAAGTSDSIRDTLMPYVPEGDALIVIGAAPDAAWLGRDAEQRDWLVDHI